ncbi:MULTISPECIES: hypothetical protein [Shewanella]
MRSAGVCLGCPPPQ